MSQIQTHCRTNGARLGIELGYACAQSINFASNKCPDRQSDVVALLGLHNHLLKVVILAQTIFDFVVKTKIARQTALTIAPHQRDQGDALYHGMVLARSVPTDQRHLRRIWFVPSAVVDNQYSLAGSNQRFHFLPKRLAVRWQSLQQAHVGIMRWRLLFYRMGLRCFNAAKHSLRRNQEVDVVHFIAFGWVHAPSVACSLSTA